MKRVRVGIIYGGRSNEHEVSLASAASVISNLDPDQYEIFPIYIHPDGRWSLPKHPPTNSSAAQIIDQSKSRPASASLKVKQTLQLVSHPSDKTLIAIEQRNDNPLPEIVDSLTLDVLFPVLHGKHGEDGTLQGLLELANLPYVGAGVFSSAAAMDKTAAKVLFKGSELPVVDYCVVSKKDWDSRRSTTLASLVQQLNFPMFVKPANLGSSIGISKATQVDELETSIELARMFDHKVLVEVAVPEARELECAVLGNDDPIVSLPGEIVSTGQFYDYAAKYLDADSKLIIPASLTEEQTSQIKKLAITAFQAIDCAGMARVDFLMDGTNGQMFLNEINTIPGFTTISMYPKLWEASGLSYSSLLDRLIELAFDRHASKQSLKTSQD